MACQLSRICIRGVRTVVNTRHRPAWPFKIRHTGHKKITNKFPVFRWRFSNFNRISSVKIWKTPCIQTDEKMLWPGAFGEHNHHAYAEIGARHLNPDNLDLPGSLFSSIFIRIFPYFSRLFLVLQIITGRNYPAIIIP